MCRYCHKLIAVGLVAVLVGFWVAPRISWSAARSPETGALRLGQVSVTYTILKEDDDYTVFYNYAADSSVAIDNVAAAIRFYVVSRAVPLLWEGLSISLYPRRRRT